MTVILLMGVAVLIFGLGVCLGQMYAIRDEMEWLEEHAKVCRVAE